MLETNDTARRIQALKESLVGRTFPAGPLPPSILGETFVAAGVSPERLAGDGAARHAAAAELLHRQAEGGAKPHRLADALVLLGYTPDRLDRLLSQRGKRLRDELVNAFRRARGEGVSPDPYLACVLILSEGVSEGEFTEARGRISFEYRLLSAA